MADRRSGVETVSTMEELMPLIREVLASGQSVRFSPMGTSMLPMLRQGIDSVVLSPAPEQLRRFDLPLYQRDNGKYVLHRVTEAGERYSCIGDNQFEREQGICREQIIGVVTSFYRGEREITVTAWHYRLYCALWHGSRRLRHFFLRCVRWLRRHLKWGAGKSHDQ